MADSRGVINLILSAAIGLIVFGATFGLMLTGSATASEAVDNGTTGDETGDILLAVVPTILGLSVALVAFVLIGRITGVDLVG